MSDLDVLEKLIDDYAHRMHSLEDAVAEHKDSEAIFKRAMEIYLNGEFYRKRGKQCQTSKHK